MASKIPKIVWAFWHSSDLPNVYKICLNSWYQHLNSDYSVRLLNMDTIGKYLLLKDLPKNFCSLTKQRQSDCIRLALLKKYGGIWMDVGIFLNDSLNWVFESGYDFVAYFIEKFQPKESVDEISNAIVENWFIATTPNNCMINQWHSFFKDVLDQCDEKSILSYQPIFGNSKTFKQISKIDDHHYLLMHVVYQHLLANDPEFRKFHQTRTFLQKAEDTALKLQSDNNWNTKKIKKQFESLLKDPKKFKQINQPVIKIRGNDVPKNFGSTIDCEDYTFVPLLFVSSIILLFTTVLIVLSDFIIPLKQR